LPRPKSVRVFQCVDRAISKYAVAVESKLRDGPRRDQDLERKGESARELYAAILTKAMTYGGADVGVIVYKSTREWIEANCFIPDWLKLAHHGGVAGSNMFENVRALFEIGRVQPPPEAIVRTAEALFGKFIQQRDYFLGKGWIPIIPDAVGNNTIEVSRLHQHRNPMGQRLLWQAREGGIIQNGGRARAGLRTAETPLDIHRWTDVPVPELGPVVPVMWADIESGLDGLMLATSGVSLEQIPDAAQAFRGILTARGLRAERGSKRVPSCDTPLIRISILAQCHKMVAPYHYQRSGHGRRLARAFSMLGPAQTRVWLEKRLGPLAWFAEGRGGERRPRGAAADK